MPDLSTFFAAVNEVDTTNVSNSNAVPTPVSVAAPFRMLADALAILSRELDNGSDLLEQMRQQLMGEAEMPPREVQGVGQEFLDGQHTRTSLECTNSHADMVCRARQSAQKVSQAGRQLPYLQQPFPRRSASDKVPCLAN